jgi:hypothetical protein
LRQEQKKKKKKEKTSLRTTHAKKFYNKTVFTLDILSATAQLTWTLQVNKSSPLKVAVLVDRRERYQPATAAEYTIAVAFSSSLATCAQS